MRKLQSSFLVVMTVVLATVPRLAEAGPCSSDIADLFIYPAWSRLADRNGKQLASQNWRNGQMNVCSRNSRQR